MSSPPVRCPTGVGALAALLRLEETDSLRNYLTSKGSFVKITDVRWVLALPDSPQLPTRDDPLCKPPTKELLDVAVMGGRDLLRDRGMVLVEELKKFGKDGGGVARLLGRGARLAFYVHSPEGEASTVLMGFISKFVSQL